MAARVGLIVLNRGTVTTFRRPEYRQTIIDITVASEGFAPRIDGWRVLEDFTASDHQYIFFSVLFRSRSRHEQTTMKDARIKTDKLNPDAFSLMIYNGYSEMIRIGIGHRTAADIASTYTACV